MRAHRSLKLFFKQLILRSSDFIFSDILIKLNIRLQQ